MKKKKISYLFLELTQIKLGDFFQIFVAFSEHTDFKDRYGPGVRKMLGKVSIYLVPIYLSVPRLLSACKHKFYLSFWLDFQDHQANEK